MVNNLWGADGEVTIRPACMDLFIIKFSSSEACDKALEEGLWHIRIQPFILRKWEPGMTKLHFDMSKIPIWIQLENVPLELFTRKRLSYIASVVGCPLYMEQITANQ
ncbi:hypothetical protein DITRI_Ditri07aG0066900 [Diplodiscus trichospermus]